MVVFRKVIDVIYYQGLFLRVYSFVVFFGVFFCLFRSENFISKIFIFVFRCYVFYDIVDIIFLELLIKLDFFLFMLQGIIVIEQYYFI